MRRRRHTPEPRRHPDLRPLALAVILTGLALTGACREAPAADQTAVVPAVTPGPTIGEAICVDTARSLVRWRGTKVGGGSHEGVVRLAGGQLLFRDSAVTGGRFTVDMTSIAVTDIPPDQSEARRTLRRHLEHEEFFGVDRFPTASFEITDIRREEHGLYTVAGNLAVRDSVHNVTFDVTAPVVGPQGVWATGRFSIDRQLWGIRFDGRTSTLRDAIVHDPIQLEITLVAGTGSCRSGGP